MHKRKSIIIKGLDTCTYMVNGLLVNLNVLIASESKLLLHSSGSDSQKNYSNYLTYPTNSPLTPILHFLQLLQKSFIQNLKHSSATSLAQFLLLPLPLSLM